MRFGNFELLASRGELETLKKLLIYCINQNPEIANLDEKASSEEMKKCVIQLFNWVCIETADLIVKWMQLGFVHGVMNTDNMSILGLTIDYGPFGWLEDYNESWTPNTTDLPGKRYSYGNQPEVAFWNLYQLANALHRLDIDEGALIECLDAYKDRYVTTWKETFVNKLGFKQYLGNKHDVLINSLMQIFKEFGLDWTIFFRNLSLISDETNELERKENLKIIGRCCYKTTNTAFENQIIEWINNYFYQIRSEKILSRDRTNLINAKNPLYVPRNYIMQQAIDKAESHDFSLINELLLVMENPYKDQGPNFEEYAKKRPDWAKDKPGCSSLSCSS